MYKNLLLIVMSGIFALLITELAVRMTLPRPGFVEREEPAGLLIPHASRDYAYAPGYSGLVETEDYRIHIDINSMGLRDDPIEPDTPVDILAIGDSFTVGFGVEADEAWPAQLESFLDASTQSAPGIRVVNAGISGYSVAQIRLLLQDLLILEPKLVVLGLYPSRFWRINNPYVYFGGDAVLRRIVPDLRVVDGGFIQSPVHGQRLERIYFWLADHFYVGAYVLAAAYELRARLNQADKGPAPPQERRTVDEDLAPLLAELESMHHLLRKRGIALLVVPVNEQETDGTFKAIEKEYNSVVEAFCLMNQIDFLDPLPALESSSLGKPIYRIGKDHHWSKEAHALVARHIGDYLRRKGSPPQRQPGMESTVIPQ